MATVSRSPRSTRLTLASSSAGPFNVGFRLFESDALAVYVNGVESSAWTLSADFADGFDDAATITFAAPQPTDTVIQIDGWASPGRDQDYAPGDPNLSRNLNVELGRLWATLSEVHQQASRALRGFAEVAPVSSLDLTAISQAAAYADQAAASAAAASAAAVAAAAAENSLLEWKGAWATATAYAPSDLVGQDGNTYVCIVAHTSGVFVDDLNANRWQIFAAKGAAGAGTGDLVAANNLSDVANVTTARNNLAVPRYARNPAYSTVDEMGTSGTNTGLIALDGLETGLPNGAAAGDHILNLVNAGDTNQAQQMLFRSDGIVQRRVKDGGSWSGWVQMISEDLMPSRRFASYDPAVDGAESFFDMLNLSTAYYGYEIDLVNYACDTDGVKLLLRLSTNNGSSWLDGATAYSSEGEGSDASGSLGLRDSGFNLSLDRAIDNAANKGVSGRVVVVGPQRSSFTQAFWNIGIPKDSGAEEAITGIGIYDTAVGVHNAMRLLWSDGQAASGKVVVRGLVDF